MPDSDSRFVEAAVQLQRYASDGDKAALEECLRACLDPAWRQAYAELGCEADAQDAAQEALLQLTRTADRYQPDRPLRPWLARHVTFACAHLRRSAARRRRREQVAVESAMREQVHAQQADDGPADHAAAEKVRAALSGLNDKDRALISLHYFAGLSQAESARELGISENAASVRLHRARGKLKNILATQGLSSGIAVLPLLAQSAPAAPAHVLPQVVQVCSAASLPTTTITLTIMEKLIMMIQTHPLMTAVMALVLSVAGMTSPMLFAADEMPPVEPPIVKEGPRWNPAAAKLLQFNDSESLIQAAADGEALRHVLLNSKPLNYLQTTEGQQLLVEWQRIYGQYIKWEDYQDVYAFVNVALYGNGLLVNGGSNPYKHLIAFDLGDQADAIRPMVKQLIGDTLPEEKAGYRVYNRGNWHLASEKDTFVFAEHRPINPVKNPEPDNELQRHPLWFNVQAEALLAAFKKHKDNLYDLEPYLGAGWESRNISAALHLEQDNDELVFKGSISGLPTSVVYLGPVIIMEEIFRVLDLPVAPVQLRLPQQMPAAGDDALLDLCFACDYIKHPVLMDAVAAELQSVKLDALADTWNGACMLAVYPGIPFPKPDMVLGLSGDLRLLHKQMSEILSQLGARDTGAQGQSITHSWSWISPLGEVQIALTKDRLLLSANQRLQELLQAVPASDALKLRIDVPTLAQRYGPMLWSLIPQKETPLGYVQLQRSVIKAPRLVLAVIENEINNKPLSEHLRNHNVAIWLGSNAAIDDYISVWSRSYQQGHEKIDEIRILFRSEAGWHFLDDPVYRNSPANENIKMVKHQLRQFEHRAGAALEDLKLHPRGVTPVIEKDKHYPELQELIKHLPRYELTWNQDDHGQQHFVEHGLPLNALLFGTAAGALLSFNVEKEAEQFQSLQKKAALLTRHQKRIEALQAIGKAMRGKQWRRPSDLLEHVPVDQLWALGLGKQPTAEQLDDLGSWNAAGNIVSSRRLTLSVDLTQRTERQSFEFIKWAIPLEQDAWILFGQHSAGITLEDPQLKASRLKPRRQAVKEQEPEDLDF